MAMTSLEPARDADLARAASAGDRAAFGAIYDRYATPVHDFCLRMVGRRDDAADITQDTFLVAAQRLGQLREPERLRAWLYAIARNECYRASKKRGRQLPKDDIEMIDSSPLIEDQIGTREMAALVWDAASGLTPEDREVLELNVRHGLEGQELADALGVNRRLPTSH